MAYDQNGAPRSGSNVSTQNRGSSAVGRGRVQAQGGYYHGPRGTRSRSGAAVGSRIGNSGRNGYAVKSRNINFQGGRKRILGLDPQVIILGALVIVLVILVVVGVSSCVRGCSSSDTQSSNNEQVNAVDSRVAYGVSEELTKQFSEVLDQNEKIAKIAAQANEYTDTELLQLALSTPEAVDFVLAYPEAAKEGAAYGDYTAGSGAPLIYNWDTRFGAVDYAGHALALTGSGPTCLAMARIGLTDQTDQTPATIAASATEAGVVTGESYMAGSFIESSAENLGLSVNTYTSNAENLSYALDAGTYLMIEVSGGSLTDDAHWVLLVTEESDGSVVVYDPTSPEASSKTWSPSVLANATSTIYALSKAGE